jgi:hypothetical protein
MAGRRKTWVYSPSASSGAKASDIAKSEVTRKANELIENYLKPTYLKPQPENYQFNYIIDIYGKWYRNYFYFCSTYHVSGPNAIAPTFEDKFARLEYVGPNQFNLAYMRHTGQWFELYTDQTLEECLIAIKDEPHFQA